MKRILLLLVIGLRIFANQVVIFCEPHDRDIGDNWYLIKASLAVKTAQNLGYNENQIHLYLNDGSPNDSLCVAGAATKANLQQFVHIHKNERIMFWFIGHGGGYAELREYGVGLLDGRTCVLIETDGDERHDDDTNERDVQLAILPEVGNVRYAPPLGRMIDHVFVNQIYKTLKFYRNKSGMMISRIKMIDYDKDTVTVINKVYVNQDGIPDVPIACIVNGDTLLALDINASKDSLSYHPDGFDWNNDGAINNQEGIDLNDDGIISPDTKVSFQEVIALDDGPLSDIELQDIFNECSDVIVFIFCCHSGGFLDNPPKNATFMMTDRPAGKTGSIKPYPLNKLEEATRNGMHEVGEILEYVWSDTSAYGLQFLCINDNQDKSYGSFKGESGDGYKSYHISLGPKATSIKCKTPYHFNLSQNYPNPFNPATMISYTLPVDGNVQLDVFDVKGRWITTLVDGNQTAGRHQVRYDGSNMPSGVYFYRIAAGSFSERRKMILVK